MKSIGKIILWVIIILIVAYIAIALSLHFIVKPDTFKKYVSSAVYKYTGHQVTFNGELSLNFFPTPGIHLTNMVVNSPKDLQKIAPYIAKIGTADIDVALFPLLTGKIVPTNLVLTNANVNIIQQAHSSTTKPHAANTYSLSDKQTQATKPTAANMKPTLTTATSETNKPNKTLQKMQHITLPKVILKASNINWIDIRNSRITKLEQINLAINPLNNGMNATVKGNLTLSEPQQNKTVFINMSLALARNPSSTLISINDLALNGIFNSEKRKDVQFNIHSPKMVLNLNQQAFNIPQYTAQYATLDITGTLQNNWQITDAGIINTLNAKTHIGNGYITELTKITFPNHGPDQISSTFRIRNIALQPLLIAINNVKNLAGTLNMKGTIHTETGGKNGIMTHLNGQTLISITNGQVFGINALQQFNDALAQLKRQSVVDKQNGRDLFKRLSGKFIIHNGIAQNDDLAYLSKNLDGSGKGSINLVNHTLDYLIYLSNQSNANFKLPLVINGSWNHPKVHADMSLIGKQIIENTFKEKAKHFFKQGRIDMKRFF